MQELSKVKNTLVSWKKIISYCRYQPGIVLFRSKAAAQKIQILASAILLAGTLLFLISLKIPNPAPPEPLPVQAKKIHEKTIARDLKIDDYAQGRKTFSMQIEKLRVVKKKLGFLRLGFLKIARVEGVTLDWYGENTSGERRLEKETQKSGNPINSKRLSHLINKLKQYLPGNIKGVELSRVKMNFFQDGRISSSIISDSAAFSSKGMHIVFKGNVKLMNGSGKSLTCEKITWRIDKKTFISTKSFIFKDRHREMSGKGFKTDFELNEIITQEREK